MDTRDDQPAGQDQPGLKMPRAWLPFTPRGIAAFASASFGRLFTVQLVMGLLAGLVVASFVRAAWFPPVVAAIRQLPSQGEIAHGHLGWTNAIPVLLSANRFVAIAVDLNHTGMLGRAVDLQIEFGRTNVILAGFLGVIEHPYPAHETIAFNRRELEPWWGAWSQAIMAGCFVGTCLGLMVIWAIIAALYIPFARVTAWLLHVPMPPGTAWRIAGAALMPGALLFTGAVYLYGWGLLDLVRLGFLGIFHLLVGWVYLPLSVLCLPRASTSDQSQTKENPFTSTSKKTAGDKPSRGAANPFAK